MQQIKGLSTVAEETWVVIVNQTARFASWKRVLAWAVVDAQSKGDKIEPVVLDGSIPLILSEHRRRTNVLSQDQWETHRILRSAEEFRRLHKELGPEFSHFGDVGHP